MANGEYDQFLARTLRNVKDEFAFITEKNTYDLPAELFWILVKALITEKGTGLRTAAQIVYDYCERKGSHIPRILSTPEENVSFLGRQEFRH